MNTLQIISWAAPGVMVVALVLIGAKISRVGFGLLLAATLTSGACAVADDSYWLVLAVYGLLIAVLAERFGAELRKGKGGAR